MSSRTKASVLNMSVGVIAQTVNLVAGIVSRTIFIRFLSVEYLGINGLLANVLTVLSFAELGIGEAVVYAMYKPAKENDTQMMCKLMQLYKKMYTIIACAVGSIGIILSFFVNYLVASPPDIKESFQIIFLLYSLNNVFSYFLTYKKSLLIVYQQNYIVTIVSQMIVLVQYVVQISVIAFTQQYYGYLFVQILATVANNIILSTVVNKKYPWLTKKTGEGLSDDVQKSITNNIKSLSIAKIAGVVSNGADNIIISKLLGLASVGLVSNYTLITSSVNGILWNGLSSITSSFGNFNVDSSVSSRRDLFDEIYLCSYWLYCFFSVGVITISSYLIEVWLGQEYVIADGIVFALVLIIYISGINFPVYVYQTTLGMYDKMKYPYLFSGLVNIVLSIILGIKYGMFGVYIATSISRLCTSEVFGGYYVYKYGLELSPVKYLIKYLFSFVFFIADIFIIKKTFLLISASGILGLAIKIIVCSIIYNSLFFITFYKTSAFKRVENRLIGIIKKAY